MGSMELEEPLEEQPPEKKPGIDNYQEEGGNASNLNERDLPKSMEGEKESSIMPYSRPHYRKLPAELNREIYLCFKLATRRKFIYGLGWGFYAMFRQILLMKDNFPGTIMYYYEIKISKSEFWCVVGLTDGEIPFAEFVGLSPNSYAIVTPIPNRNFYQFLLVGQRQRFEFPDGVIRQDAGNVTGCGILMDPNDKLTIFFTINGILMSPIFPIDPTIFPCQNAICQQ